MAIKIDLLPDYVGLSRWFKRVLSLCIVLLGGLATVLALLYQQQNLNLQTAQADVENIQKVKVAAEESEKSAIAKENEAKPQENAMNYMVLANKSGPERGAMIHLITKYITENTLVGSIDVSDGTKVHINAAVNDTRAYNNFITNLRRGATPEGPLFSSPPSSSGIGGFPSGPLYVEPLPDVNGQPVLIDKPLKIPADGNLKYPVQLPGDPPGMAAPAAPTPG